MENSISSQKFNNYLSLCQSAKNWDIHCAYQLLPYALEGENHVIELPSIQLSYSSREGGFMHSAIAPEDSVSIAVIQECEGIASFDRMKLHQGDIVFFNDSKALTFMSKAKIKVAIVSIPYQIQKSVQTDFRTLPGHFMRDKRNILTTALQNILTDLTHQKNLPDLKKIEERLIVIICELFETESIEEPKLTKGENIAFDILEKVYGHMDGNLRIEALAKEYAVSEHTLQKSFKALFGFTPKRFFRLLKLNHVHYDLTNADPKSYSVSRIAQKWGFFHMGRFSRYYTDLFGENPSITLKEVEKREKSMHSECAARQEEIETI